MRATVRCDVMQNLLLPSETRACMVKDDILGGSSKEIPGLNRGTSSAVGRLE